MSCPNTGTRHEVDCFHPFPFVHIDWCESLGTYMAPDCDCPCPCELGRPCGRHAPEETYFVEYDGTEHGPERPGL